MPSIMLFFFMLFFNPLTPVPAKTGADEPVDLCSASDAITFDQKRLRLYSAGGKDRFINSVYVA